MHPTAMQALMSAFEFSIEDLHQNRAGRATPEQLQKAQRRDRFSQFFAFGLAGCMLANLIPSALIGLAVAAIGGLYILQRVDDMGSAIRLLFSAASVAGGAVLLGLLFAGIPLLIIIGVLWQRRKVKRDEVDGRVLVIHGPISLDRKRQSDVPDTYYLVVDNTRFTLQNRQHETVRPFLGHPMTIYYLPNTKHIVSLELANSSSPSIGQRE